MTHAQRINARQDKIWERAKATKERAELLREIRDLDLALELMWSASDQGKKLWPLHEAETPHVHKMVARSQARRRAERNEQ